MFDGFSDFRIGGKNEQAVFSSGQTDLGGSAQHAFRFHFPHHGLADGEATGKLRAGKGAGDFVADLVILRTTDDLAEGGFAAIDLGDFQAVCVRVLDGFHDLGDDDAFRSDAFGNDALDFDAGEGEEIVDFLDGFTG